MALWTWPTALVLVISDTTGNQSSYRRVSIMLRRTCTFLTFGLCLLLAPHAARALETDQFTLPPDDLVDATPIISKKVMAAIETAVDKCNQQYREHLAKSESAEKPWEILYHRHQAKEAKAGIAIPKMVYDQIGKGLPEASIEIWLRKTKFEEGQVLFELPYDKSIFGMSAATKPLLLGAMAPTVKLHGVLMGTDKVGHVVQQGYDYLVAYRKALKEGKTEAKAVRAAVKLGVKMERSWGGQWWTGAYSNADLACNYAGFKFYLNLTQPVKIGDKTHPPILIRQDDQWCVNPAIKGQPLKPFVTLHYDEAFNPAWHDVTMRPFVRNGIRTRGAEWAAHYRTDRTREQKRLKELSTWFGEDYGHCGFKDVITVVNAYFDTLPATASEPTPPAEPDPDSDIPPLAADTTEDSN